MANHDGDVADLLVIFGVTGDLAREGKFRAPCRLEQRRPPDFPVIGLPWLTKPS